MTESKNTYWSRQLDNLASEISRLCIVCDINMLEPGVAERILRNDDSVCGRKNPKVFEVLRKHVMAFCQVEDHAIKRLGAGEVLPILDEIRTSIARLRGVEK